MPQMTIKVNCGCGEQFTTLADAEHHTRTTHHTTTIAGSITPTASDYATGVVPPTVAFSGPRLTHKEA